MTKTNADETYVQALGAYDFHISSQLITEYETSTLFEPGAQRAICSDGSSKGDFLLFCGGKDETGKPAIYMFHEPKQSGQGTVVPLERKKISNTLLAGFVPETSPDSMKAFNTPDGQPLLSLFGQLNGKHTFAFSYYDKNKSAEWDWIYVNADKPHSGWDIGFSSSGRPYFILSSLATRNSHVHIIDDLGNVSLLSLPIDAVEILDVKSVNLKYLRGTTLLVVARDEAGYNHLFVMDNSLCKGFRPLYVSEVLIPGGVNPSFVAVHREGAEESQIFIGANGSHNANLFSGMQAFRLIPEPAKDPIQHLYYWHTEKIFEASCEAEDFTIGHSGYELNIWFEGDYGDEGYWLMRSRYDTKGWLAPVPLMQINSETEAASMVLHNPKDDSLDLFVELPSEDKRSPRFRHYWADSSSSLWMSNEVSLGNLDSEEVRELPVSATYLTLLNQQGDIAEGVRVQVGATQEISVRVQGHNYRLHPGEWITETTDESGSISILCEATDMNSPVYLLGLPGHEKAIRLESGYYTQKRLQSTDFTQVQGVDPADAEGYKTFVKESTGKARELAACEELSLVDVRQLKQSLLLPPVHRVRKKKKTKPKAEFMFACVFSDDKKRVFIDRKDFLKHQKKATPLLKGFFKKVLKDLKKAVEMGASLVGDVVHATAHFVHEATVFIVEKVEEAVKLVVHIAGEIIHIVAETLEQCLALISTTMKKVWNTTKEIVRDLGYVFKWKETKEMMKVIQALGSVGLQHMQEEFGNEKSFTRSHINDLFDKADGKIKKYLWSHGYPDYEETELKKHESVYHELLRSREHLHLMDKIKRCEEKLHDYLEWGEEEDFAMDYVLPDATCQNVGTAIMKNHSRAAVGIVKNPKSTVEELRNALLADADVLLRQCKLGLGRNMNRIAKKCKELQAELAKPMSVEIPLMRRMHQEVEGSSSMTRNSLSSLMLAVPVHFLYRKALHARKLEYSSELMQQLAAVKTEADLKSVIESPKNLKAGINPLEQVVDLGYQALHNQIVMEALYSGYEIYSCFSAKKKQGVIKGKKMKIASFIGISGYTVYRYYMMNEKLKKVASLKNEALNLKIMSIGLSSCMLSVMSLVRAWEKTLEDRSDAKVLATASSFIALLPLVLCACSFPKDYNGYDYADMVWKLLNGIKLSGIFLLKTYPEEAFPVVGISTAAIVIIMLVEMEHEDPSRFMN